MEAKEFKIKLATLFSELAESQTRIQGVVIVNDIKLLIDDYTKKEKKKAVAEALEKEVIEAYRVGQENEWLNSEEAVWYFNNVVKPKYN